MSDQTIKAHWLDTYNRLCAEAGAFRNSQAVSFGMLDAYDALSSDNRPIVHSILSEWVLSDDDRLRYDAEFLISQRAIREMKTSVEEALVKCEGTTGPEAQYEAKKLRRILGELG